MSARVDAVLAELTLPERIALCSGADFWHTHPVERAGVPSIMLTDGPHGLRKQADSSAPLDLGNAVPATCYPAATALASSWDPELVRAVGAAIGAESLAERVSVLLGPGVNIKRSPLGGRNFEYFSEDPFLTGRLGATFVEGVQSAGVAACVKHFAVNNQETDRMRISADVDERTLREIYLAAFEHIVTTAKPQVVMAAYNRINGTYACEDPWLLTTLLREEWGFDGVVVSDWGAVADPVAALGAGLDLQMPGSGGRAETRIGAAVAAGELDAAVVDRAADHVLALVTRTTREADDAPAVDFAAHHQLARTVAADCMVLLKNEEDLLPLDPSAGRIAVIGELARTPRYQGAGSSQVTPTRLDDALTELLAMGAPVAFAPGYRLTDGASASVAVTAGPSHSEPSSSDAIPTPRDLRDEAVTLAKTAATTVVFVGLPPDAESEGFDRTTIDLPAEQLALLEAVCAVSTRVVVVLANGGVVRTAPWDAQVSAILETWLPGQAGGGAIADVLLGRAAPSGRLAETIPLRLEDCAAQLNFPGEAGHVRYGEGLFVGYRGYDRQDLSVSYPFGHGLTYTTFAYSDVTAQVAGQGDDTRVTVHVTVTNTGARPGKEVVQVYVSDPECMLLRPVRELKAFTKVTLMPGEHQVVSMTLRARELSFFHPMLGRWVLEPGTFEIAVGASSRDLKARCWITVDAPPLRLLLGPDSTVADWAADPTGSELLTAALGALGPVLMAPQTLTLLGGLPLGRLTSFPGSPLDDATYAGLVEQAQAAGVFTFDAAPSSQRGPSRGEGHPGM